MKSQLQLLYQRVIASVCRLDGNKLIMYVMQEEKELRYLQGVALLRKIIKKNGQLNIKNNKIKAKGLSNPYSTKKSNNKHKNERKQHHIP